jgi:hypothetical protein
LNAPESLADLKGALKSATRLHLISVVSEATRGILAAR